MEKVRVAHEVLHKYHFWILLTLIVLITFGTWFMATGDRAEQYTKRKSLIDGQFTAVTAISSTRDHPSEKYIKADRPARRRRRGRRDPRRARPRQRQ